MTGVKWQVIGNEVREVHSAWGDPWSPLCRVGSWSDLYLTRIFLIRCEVYTITGQGQMQRSPGTIAQVQVSMYSELRKGYTRKLYVAVRWFRSKEELSAFTDGLAWESGGWIFFSKRWDSVSVADWRSGDYANQEFDIGHAKCGMPLTCPNGNVS